MWWILWWTSCSMFIHVFWSVVVTVIDAKFILFFWNVVNTVLDTMFNVHPYLLKCGGDCDGRQVHPFLLKCCGDCGWAAVTFVSHACTKDCHQNQTAFGIGVACCMYMGLPRSGFSRLTLESLKELAGMAKMSHFLSGFLFWESRHSLSLARWV